MDRTIGIPLNGSYVEVIPDVWVTQKRTEKGWKNILVAYNSTERSRQIQLDCVATLVEMGLHNKEDYRTILVHEGKDLAQE